MIHFLFPRDPHAPDRAEDIFVDQHAALIGAGLSASLCSGAELAGRKPLRSIPTGSHVVYRGWMLTNEEYESLASAIVAVGAIPFTTPQEYLATHHLPRWYPLLTDHTPETRVLPADADLVAEIRALGWGTVFLKDYVKSLKTSPGSVVRDPAEAPAVVAAMLDYRGMIEDGICVRRFESFEPGTERRYFVLNGMPFAPTSDGPIPDTVRACANRISSPFFSVDVAVRSDCVTRVIEVGDGQVSDLVGWTAEQFARIWIEQ